MDGENTVNDLTIEMHLNGGGADMKYAVGERTRETQHNYLLLQVIMWIPMSNMRSVCKCWLCFVFSVCLSKLALASTKSALFLVKLGCPVDNNSYCKLRQAEHSG